MLQVLHKILAIIIAVVVLFTSLSFTIEKHICQDKVMDVSFIAKSNSCDMHTKDNMEDDQESVEDNCCVEKTNLIPGNKNEQQAIDKLEINQVKFIVAFNYTYLNLFEAKDNFVSFVDTSPLIIDRNYQVLHQTFLI